MLLDESVPFGTLSVNMGVFDCSWMRIGKLGCNEEDARWIHVSTCKNREFITMSSSTVWSYFRQRSGRGTVSLRVTFALFPPYIDFLIAPVEPLSVLKLCLLSHRVSQMALLDERLSSRIEETIKQSDIRAILLEGDSWWMNVDLSHDSQPIEIPVIVAGLSHERYFDASRCRVELSLSQKLAILPPRPLAVIGKDFGRLLVEEVSEKLVDCLRERTPMIFNLVGDCRSGQCVIDGACGTLGMPVMTLPIEDVKKLSKSECPAAWILTISKCRRQPYKVIKTVSKLECLAFCVVFVLSTEELDASLAKLLTRVWKLCEFKDSEDQSPSDPEVAKSLQSISPAMSEAVLCLSQLDQIPPIVAVKSIRRRAGGSRINRAEIPQVYWDDVAGLEDAKQTLIESIKGMLVDDSRVPRQLGRRCGILLHGPPGTGKTLIAKAIATEFNMSFLSIKGPELLDIYIGESEAHIRDVFAQARASNPCILFFDELDSLAVSRGKDGDAGGVTDRLVSQLLTEIDTITLDSAGAGVFLIGATNRPDLLDAALLRPGRFDKILYLGIPQTSQERLAILRATAKPYLMSVDVDLETLVEVLPKTLSPADLASICHTAMKAALRKVISRSAASNRAVLNDQAVVIGWEDMMEAAAMVRPSVSQSQLLKDFTIACE